MCVTWTCAMLPWLIVLGACLFGVVVAVVLDTFFPWVEVREYKTTDLDLPEDMLWIRDRLTH